MVPAWHKIITMMSAFMFQHRIPLALILFTLASAFFHFISIGRPSVPVFDEIYFATYASDYAMGRAHYDLHPPLGKLIYAALLMTAPASRRDAQFIRIYPGPDGMLVTQPLRSSFGEFPYKRLRMTSAVIGATLPLAVWLLLRRLGLSQGASLVGSGLVLLENALLV